ncbi:hypothetical protein [Actinomadura coerulea]|uniref:hypothetical protein n=1 Tax=Actinomadura coerulea TaxID=46159 RepID=UPI003439DEF2
MSVRLNLGGAQPPEPNPISLTGVVIVFAVIVVGVVVAKEPSLAVPIGTAAAVAAVLVAVLVR